MTRWVVNGIAAGAGVGLATASAVEGDYVIAALLIAVAVSRMEVMALLRVNDELMGSLRTVRRWHERAARRLD